MIIIYAHFVALVMEFVSICLLHLVEPRTLHLVLLNYFVVIEAIHAIHFEVA